MKNIIGGQELPSLDRSVIQVINPATDEVIDTVPASTVEDVNTAVSCAKDAFPAWKNTPMYERAQILLKFADLVEKNAESLALTLSKETGKTIREARTEIANTKWFVSGYIERAKHLYGINIPTGIEPGQDETIQYTVREPLGVVAAIIPFNFPCDLFGQKVPSALIMGNTVIVKPSSLNPLTIHRFGLLMRQAGIPDGVLNIVSGRGEIVGEALAKHKDVHLVTLTGSTQVGKETMKNASENLTHVTLELGGNDAFIVDKDANLDLAVEELVQGRMYNTGQVCCASKRFLVHNSIKDVFTNKVIERLSKIKIGIPTKENSEMGCLISSEAAKKVDEQVKFTIKQGAKLAFGGRRNKAYFEPCVLTNVTKDMDVMNDMEIFGPVVPICGFDSIEEAIKIANQSSFGLCSCIITENMKTAFKVANELEVGGAIINGSSFHRSMEMPFGGWKNSGIGNEGITTTLNEMSKIKTIVLKNVLK